jgi:hypothetical protein
MAWLVIVDNLDVIGIAVMPTKTDPPLFVYANTVLAPAVSLHALQPVTGRAVQIVQDDRAIKLAQFPLGDSFDGSKALHALALMKELCILAAKALDHP